MSKPSDYKDELVYFWTLLDITKEIMPEKPPEDFLTIYYQNLEEYADAITNLPLTQKKDWGTNIERAGEAISNIIDGLIDWSSNSLKEEEKGISDYANTERIWEKFDKIDTLRNKSAFYRDDKDYINSSKSFLKCLKEIKNVEKDIRNIKKGTRNIKSSQKMDRRIALISLFWGFVGVGGISSIIQIWLWSKFSWVWGLTGLAIFVIILLALLHIIFWRKNGKKS